MPVSSRQLSKFRALLGSNLRPLVSNFRLPQPTCGRSVFHACPGERLLPTLFSKGRKRLLFKRTSSSKNQADDAARGDEASGRAEIIQPVDSKDETASREKKWNFQDDVGAVANAVKYARPRVTFNTRTFVEQKYEDSWQNLANETLAYEETQDPALPFKLGSVPKLTVYNAASTLCNTPFTSDATTGSLVCGPESSSVEIGNIVDNNLYPILSSERDKRKDARYNPVAPNTSWEKLTNAIWQHKDEDRCSSYDRITQIPSVSQAYKNTTLVPNFNLQACAETCHQSDCSLEETNPQNRRMSAAGTDYAKQCLVPAMTGEVHPYHDWPFKHIEFNESLRSPVNIRVEGVPGKVFPPLRVKAMPVASRLVNTGNTAKITLSQLSEPWVFSGGPLTAEYCLSSIHFHWGPKGEPGCEHRLSGARFTMESHITLLKRGFSCLKDARRVSAGVVMVAIFLQGGFPQDNPSLDELTCALTRIRYPYTSTEMGPNALRWLADHLEPRGFYTYPGTLTDGLTPEETVTWIVYPVAVPASDYQVEQFRRLEEGGHTMVHPCPPLHPLNARPIFFST